MPASARAPPPLGRQQLKWLLGLDLSAPVRSLRRDFSSGLLCAEILSRYFPGEVSLHSYSSVTSAERKSTQWGMLAKVFKKTGVALSKREVEAVVAAKTDDAAAAIVNRLHAALATAEGYAAADSAVRDYHASGPEVPASLAPPAEHFRERARTPPRGRAPQAAGYGRRAPPPHSNAHELRARDAGDGVVLAKHGRFVADLIAGEDDGGGGGVDFGGAPMSGHAHEQQQQRQYQASARRSLPYPGALQPYNDQYNAPRRAVARKAEPAPARGQTTRRASESRRPASGGVGAGGGYAAQARAQPHAHAFVPPPVVTTTEGPGADVGGEVVRVAANPSAAFVFGGGSVGGGAQYVQHAQTAQAVQSVTTRMEEEPFFGDARAHTRAHAHAGVREASAIEYAYAHALPEPDSDEYSRGSSPESAMRAAMMPAGADAGRRAMTWSSKASSKSASRENSRASLNGRGTGYSSRAARAKGGGGRAASMAAAPLTVGVAPQCASGVPGHLRGADFVPYTQADYDAMPERMAATLGEGRDGYWEVGRLGPDLDTEDKVWPKRRRRARVRARGRAPRAERADRARSRPRALPGGGPRHALQGERLRAARARAESARARCQGAAGHLPREACAGRKDRRCEGRAQAHPHRAREGHGVRQDAGAQAGGPACALTCARQPGAQRETDARARGSLHRAWRARPPARRLAPRAFAGPAIQELRGCKGLRRRGDVGPRPHAHAARARPTEGPMALLACDADGVRARARVTLRTSDRTAARAHPPAASPLGARTLASPVLAFTTSVHTVAARCARRLRRA